MPWGDTSEMKKEIPVHIKNMRGTKKKKERKQNVTENRYVQRHLIFLNIFFLPEL